MSSTCCFCRVLDLPAALVLHLFERHGLGARSMLAVGIFRTTLVGRPVKNGDAHLKHTATEKTAAVPVAEAESTRVPPRTAMRHREESHEKPLRGHKRSPWLG